MKYDPWDGDLQPGDIVVGNGEAHRIVSAAPPILWRYHRISPPPDMPRAEAVLRDGELWWVEK